MVPNICELFDDRLIILQSSRPPLFNNSQNVEISKEFINSLAELHLGLAATGRTGNILGFQILYGSTSNKLIKSKKISLNQMQLTFMNMRQRL